MSQKQVERPQDKKPRPQEDKGPKTNLDIDIGDTDVILRELDIIEHPEKYTVEQRTRRTEFWVAIRYGKTNQEDGGALPRGAAGADGRPQAAEDGRHHAQ